MREYALAILDLANIGMQTGITQLASAGKARVTGSFS